MGGLRLSLAIAVVLAHLDITEMTSAPYLFLVSHIQAVRMFFVISGFYMALVLSTKYAAMPVSYFYFNRLARLLPAYWIVVGGLIIVTAVLHKLPGNVTWIAHPSAFDLPTYLYLVATNIVIIAQDIAAFIVFPNGQRGHEYLIVPQAWSLGTEFWFYFLAPLLVRLGTRPIAALIGAGFCIRAGIDYSDFSTWPWTQRFFPAEIPYFLMGIVSYRSLDAFKRIIVAATGPATLCAILAFVFYTGHLGFGRENDLVTSFGLALATAVVTPILFLTIKGAADSFASELSYPVYISHLPVLQVMDGQPIWRQLCMVAVASVMITLFVERPVTRWRHDFIR